MQGIFLNIFIDYIKSRARARKVTLKGRIIEQYPPPIA